MLSTILLHRPLLVGLQEVLAPQLHYINTELAGMYTAFGVGREDGESAGEHTAVLVLNQPGVKVLKHGTFWLGTTPAVPGSIGWDAANPRTVTWVCIELERGAGANNSNGDVGTKARRVLFLNTHMDHMGRLSREESSKQIKRWIRSYDCTTLTAHVDRNGGGKGGHGGSRGDGGAEDVAGEGSSSSGGGSGCDAIILTGDLNSERTDNAYRTLVEGETQPTHAPSSPSSSAHFYNTAEISALPPFGPLVTFTG